MAKDIAKILNKQIISKKMRKTLGTQLMFQKYYIPSIIKISQYCQQFNSVDQLCLTLCNPMPACQTSLYINNSRSLLKLSSTEQVMRSNHLILCCSLLLPPSIFLSISVFSNKSVLCNRWPKSIGVSGSASVLPMNIQD